MTRTPVDPPVVHVRDPRVEARRYACPDRTLLVLFDGPYVVADFTSLATLTTALGDRLADLTLGATA